MQRVGRKNIPTFRFVLTDSKNSAKSGRFLEILGFHNPVSKKSEIAEDRVKYWFSKGAQASDSVHNYLVGRKIIQGSKRNVISKRITGEKSKQVADNLPPTTEKASTEGSEGQSNETEKSSLPGPEEEGKKADVSPIEAPPQDEAKKEEKTEVNA